MSLKSKLGFHTWNGCKCDDCGKTRDEQHTWNGCKCYKCDKTRDEQHVWNGCKCSKCGKTRDEQHDWGELSCNKCGTSIVKYFIQNKDLDSCIKLGKSAIPELIKLTNDFDDIRLIGLIKIDYCIDAAKVLIKIGKSAIDLLVKETNYAFSSPLCAMVLTEMGINAIESLTEAIVKERRNIDYISLISNGRTSNFILALINFGNEAIPYIKKAINNDTNYRGSGNKSLNTAELCFTLILKKNDSGLSWYDPCLSEANNILWSQIRNELSSKDKLASNNQEKIQENIEEEQIKEIHIYIQDGGNSNIGLEIIKSLRPNCLSQAIKPNIIMHNVIGEWPSDIQFYTYGNLKGQGISLSDTNCLVENGYVFGKNIYIVYLK